MGIDQGKVHGKSDALTVSNPMQGMQPYIQGIIFQEYLVVRVQQTAQEYLVIASVDSSLQYAGRSWKNGMAV